MCLAIGVFPPCARAMSNDRTAALEALFRESHVRKVPVLAFDFGAEMIDWVGRELSPALPEPNHTLPSLSTQLPRIQSESRAFSRVSRTGESPGEVGMR